MSVIRWEDTPQPPEELIAELRSRPGYWAVVYEDGPVDDYWNLRKTLRDHPRIEARTNTFDRGEGEPLRMWARWTCCCH